MLVSLVVERIVLLVMLFYWGGVYLGTSSWAMSQGYITESDLLRVVHWILLALFVLTAALNALRGRSDPRRRVRLTMTDVGVALMMTLAVIDGLFRSGLESLATKSLIIAAILYYCFRFSFVDLGSRRLLAGFFVGLSLVAGGVILIELFNDNMFSKDAGRPAGLFVNPNVAAAAIALVGCACAGWVSEKFRLAYSIFILFVVMLTLSRSTVLSLAVASLMLLIFQYRQASLGYLKSGWIGGVAVSIAAVMVVVFALQSENRFKYALWDSSSRFVSFAGSASEAWWNERESALITPPSGGSTNGGSDRVAEEELARLAVAEAEDSLTARQVLFQRNLQVFAEHPWVGVGAHKAFYFGAHNTYLLYGVSFGILGSLAFGLVVVGFLWPTYGNAYRTAFAICLGLVAFFSHGILVNNPLLIALSVASCTLAGRTTETRSPVRVRVERCSGIAAD